MAGVCDSLWAVTEDPSGDLTNSTVGHVPPPSLSHCVQDTVLVWGPSLYLSCVLPFYAWSLKGSPLGTVPLSPLNITRQVVSILLIVASIIKLGGGIHHSVNPSGEATPATPWHYFLAAIVQAVSMVLILVTVELERRRGIRSSLFLLIFWLLVILCGFFVIWSQCVVHLWVGGPLYFGVTLVYYGLALLQTVLCTLVDKAPTGGSERMDQFKVPNPTYYVSSLTKLFVAHASSLVYKSYRKCLELSDIWDLEPKYQASTQMANFESNWMYEVNKSIKSGIKKDKKDEEDIDGGTPLMKKHIFNPDKKQDTPSNTYADNLRMCNKANYQPSLLKAIFKTFGIYFALTVIIRAVIKLCLFMNPILLRKIIHFIDDETESDWNGYIYVLSLIIFIAARCILLNQIGFIHCKTNLSIRNALMGAIYNKALKLSSSARQGSTVGEIVNLMAVDSMRYQELIHFINMAWIIPVQCPMAIVFLYGMLGPSVLAGFTVFIVQIPINYLLGKIRKQLETKKMKYKDERIKMTNEILSGIKVLKLYAWEKSFEAQVHAIRAKELRVIKIESCLGSLMHLIFCCTPILMALISFATYVYSSTDHILTAEKAFVSLVYFDLVRGPLQELPNIINSFIRCQVSHKRILKFLLNDEIDLESIIRNSKDCEYSVAVKSGYFGWELDAKPMLKNIKLEARPGTTVAIVGSVGAGKSSILSALMGEMHKQQGTVSLKGEIAYVPQLAWIQQATLKNNILFNSPYVEDRYNEILDVCALRTDLEILPGGDETEIGEKGINLSGGQKLRVSLARALYQDADLYFLDDPLSAVDAHVGKSIFEKVIGPNGMLKDKTRVMVTHALWVLPFVDEIYVIENGLVKERGSYPELMARKQALSELMKAHDATKDSVIGVTSDVEEKKDGTSNGDVSISSQLDKHCSFERQDSYKRPRTYSTSSHKVRDMKHDLLMRQFSNRSTAAELAEHHRAAIVSSGAPSQCSLVSGESMMSLSGLHQVMMGDCIPEMTGVAEDGELSGLAAAEETPKKAKTPDEKGALVGEEEVEKGKVKMSVYTTYFKAIGLFPCIALVICAIGSNGFDVGASLWLAKWSDAMNDYDEERKLAAANNLTFNGTKPIENVNMGLYISIYAVLGFFQAISAFVRLVIGILAGLRTSKAQHIGLLRAILKAPMEFFDRTPLGRILNRFSSDVATIDDSLPHLITWLLAAICHVLGSMIIISIVTPWSLLVWVGLAVILFWLFRFYIPTQRQSQRLQSVSKSPVYAHFGESLQGMSTIRAYQRQKVFLAECLDRINEWGKCTYFSDCAHRWLALALSILHCTVVFTTALMMVSFRNTLTAGLVGLALTYSFRVTEFMSWLIEIMAHLESEIVSVERVQQYTNIKSEAPWENDDAKPAVSWPQEGKVCINQLSNRYREGLDLVLKGITCNIQPAEKIGIVGRTGAGKSTLTMTLFRMLEAAGGSITIDNIDISKLGLHDLRSRLTVIPQDPVLFSGKLRMNLDPFDVYTDDQVWQALKQAHLSEWVGTLPAQLQHECSEGGENLSIGQRQLVCLARALLRKTKVLILDEATAACDVETDDLIQSTIRTEFAGCTVLTVAHRLNTIMDYDRIMVLGAGEICEIDSPKNLLSDHQSVFYSMAKDAGLVK